MIKILRRRPTDADVLSGADPRYTRKPKVHRTSYLTRARQATGELIARLRAERERSAPSYRREPRPSRLDTRGGRHRRPMTAPAGLTAFLARAHGSASRTRSAARTAARTAVARAASKVGVDPTGRPRPLNPWSSAVRSDGREIRWHGDKRRIFHHMNDVTADHTWKLEAFA